MQPGCFRRTQVHFLKLGLSEFDVHVHFPVNAYLASRHRVHQDHRGVAMMYQQMVMHLVPSLQYNLTVVYHFHVSCIVSNLSYETIHVAPSYATSVISV